MIEIDLYKQVDLLHQFQIHLPKFKKLRHNVWAFRCPYCGDSKTNINKRRGYLFEYENNLFFKCFNCSDSKSFMGLIKDLEPSLYSELMFDAIVGQKKKAEPKRIIETIKPKLEKKENTLPTKQIVKISDLAHDHVAYTYLTSRLLNDHFDRLYYTESIFNFVLNNYKDENASKYPSEPAIVIPIININKEVIGYQFRTLFSKIRYYTFAISENKLVFGVDTIDTKKPVYVVEGPLDSLFIDNCIAAMSSDLTGVLSRLSFTIDPIFIFDNEPWSEQITRLMIETIDNGYKIAFWNKPEIYGKKEDINDMIIKGKEKKIVDLLNNVYDGLGAYAEYNTWIS